MIETDQGCLAPVDYKRSAMRANCPMVFCTEWPKRGGRRKRLIEAYERRLDSLVTHLRFGHALSYRRVFEVQAWLLDRFLTGEIPAQANTEFRVGAVSTFVRTWLH